MVRKASDRPAGSSLHLATCPAPQRPEVRWGAVPMASAGAPGLPRLPPWPPAPLGPLSRRAGCPQGPPFSRPPEQHSPELSPGPDVCTDPGERLAGRGGGGQLGRGPKPAYQLGRREGATWPATTCLGVHSRCCATGQHGAAGLPRGPQQVLWLSSGSPLPAGEGGGTSWIRPARGEVWSSPLPHSSPLLAGSPSPCGAAKILHVRVGNYLSVSHAYYFYK